MDGLCLCCVQSLVFEFLLPTQLPTSTYVHTEAMRCHQGPRLPLHCLLLFRNSKEKYCRPVLLQSRDMVPENLQGRVGRKWEKSKDKRKVRVEMTFRNLQLTTKDPVKSVRMWYREPASLNSRIITSPEQ